MVLMLVGGDHQMQVSVRGFVDIGDYVGQLDIGGLRAQGAAVDEDVCFFTAKIKGEEETVAKALAVHAHSDIREIRRRGQQLLSSRFLSAHRFGFWCETSDAAGGCI